MANVFAKLGELRKWIDSEDEQADNALPIVAAIQRYESEIFLHKVLTAIAKTLEQEIVRLPLGTYVPSQFAVYLSEADDKTLRKDKRSFFELSLSELILTNARERAGDSALTTEQIKVALKVNALLSAGEIEVLPADNEADAIIRDTFEIPEQKVVREKQPEPPKTELDKIINVSRETIDDLRGTIDDDNAMLLYRVEVWCEGTLLETIPVIQREMIVGREDVEGKANIRLQTDNQKISRRHASLVLDIDNRLHVKSFHRINPTIVEGKAITNEGEAVLDQNGEIKIYEFTLRVKF